MEVLVTGAAGFIGSNLVNSLLNQNKIIVGIDKDYNGRKRLDNLMKYKDDMYMYSTNLVSKNFKMIWDNINKIMSYHYCFDDIDTVYHLAAASDIKKSLTDTSWDFENNILGTHSVLEMMRKKDIKNIVFTSTSALYGENPPMPTPENTPLEGLSLYSASKICGEFLIKAYCELYGIKGYIFRFGNVVGKNQHRGVIYDFIQKLKNNPKRLEILGDGQQVKSYVHVSDVINAMLTIPKKVKKNVDVFNIATYDWIDVTSLANILCKELKLKPDYYYTGGNKGWKGDIPKIQLSIEKALNIGWAPEYNCEEAIRKAIGEINDNS